MDKKTTQRVLEDYRGAEDPMLQKQHVLKKEMKSKRKPVQMVVGTDGSAKAAEQCPDKQSFCGWGFYGVLTYESGRSKPCSKFGGLHNDTALTAELAAIAGVLDFVEIPTQIEFVTDSSEAIKYLTSDVEELRSRWETIKAKKHDPVLRRELSRQERLDFPSLDMAIKIHEKMANPYIRGVTIEWVRSHNLDDKKDRIKAPFDPNKLPNPDHAETAEGKKLVRNMLLNFHADSKANEGSRRAVRKGLLRLKGAVNRYREDQKEFAGNTISEDEFEKRTRMFNKAVSNVRKNLFYSRFCRIEASYVLATEQKGLLPDTVLTSLFEESEAEQIKNGQYLSDPELEKYFPDAEDKDIDRRAALIDQVRYQNKVVSSLLISDFRAPDEPPVPQKHQQLYNGPGI